MSKHRNIDLSLYSGIGVFLLFAVFGFWISISAWDGMIYVSDLKLKGLNGRFPAAIRKDLDFSRLNGAELMSASQKRLLTAARVITTQKNVGIEFGQFIIRSSDGQRQLACDFYDRVRVRLQAEGVAVSGERPEIEINAPCATSSDLALTEPIWIPAEEIMSGEAADGDAKFGSDDNSSSESVRATLEQTLFRFKNMARHWPKRWAVTEVTLYRESEPGREIHVDQSDMKDFNRKPLIVTWPDSAYR
jgi:hypothetical protein